MDLAWGMHLIIDSYIKSGSEKFNFDENINQLIGFRLIDAIKICLNSNDVFLIQLGCLKMINNLFNGEIQSQ